LVPTTPNLTDFERLADRFALGIDRGEGSRHFLRIKVPNGIITSQQLKAIFDLAAKFGKGYTEITDRQDIQLHWIEPEEGIEVFKSLDSLGFTTDKCGQSYPGAKYGDVRNIVGCPVAGVDRDELIDASPIVKKLNDHFAGNQNYLNLPRKFKPSISGCQIGCTVPEVNDLSFIAVQTKNGIGFAVLAGGGAGAPPMLAKPLGILVWPGDVFDVAVAVVEIFRDHGKRESKAKARFKWLVAEWGAQKLRVSIEEKMGRRFDDYSLGRIQTGGEHTGIQPQKQEGYFYVNVPVLGGNLTNGQLLKISDLGERYGSAELRLTPSQNIIIINVPRRNLYGLKEELKGIGHPLEAPRMRWTTIACAGNFCGKAPESPKQRVKQILTQLEDELEGDVNDLDIRLAVSGCPNACGRHVAADIGLQAVKVRVDGGMDAGYDLYLRRGNGEYASLAKLVKKGILAGRVGDTVRGIVSAYLESRKDSESFREFCSRHSREELEALLTNGSSRKEV
jgi:sulfite reductase beta subunit-like hemoprotein